MKKQEYIEFEVHFSDITWEGDDDNKDDLPESYIEATIKVPKEDILDFQDFLTDWLSDEYGFLLLGYNYEIVSIRFTK